MNTNRIAIAASLAMGIVYTIFSGLLAFLPVQFLDIVSKSHYVNFSQIILQVNFTNFVTGLLFHMILVYLFFLLTGFIYHIGTGCCNNKHVHVHKSDEKYMHAENKFDNRPKF